MSEDVAEGDGVDMFGAPTIAAKKPARKKRKPKEKPVQVQSGPEPSPAAPPIFMSIVDAIALLELGLQEGDWSKVAEAYWLLSGKPAPQPPPDYRSILEDIAGSISHLLGGNARSPSVTKTAPRSRPAVAPVASEEEVIVKEYRKPFAFQKLTCSACGKSEEIHPALVPRRVDAQDDTPSFICNKCIVRRKGG